MRAASFLALAAAAIAARRPILVQSDPGVGKSALIWLAAKMAGAQLILSHPVVEDPTDAKGLPWVAGNKTEAVFLPFGALARALRATELTVWFLDDFGQASPAVQAAYMQLLLTRRINGHVLPDCVTFVAATNKRTAGMGVTGMLEPVKSRFATIVTLDAHIEDWVAWASKAGINETVIAYLRFDSGMLHQFVASSDMSNTPSPRTWENFSDVLSWGLAKGDRVEAGAGAIGEGAAGQYFAFEEQVGHLPHADAIFADPESFDIRDTRPEVLYAVVTTLAIRATAANFASVCRFAERLENDGRGEFASLVIRDATRRDPALEATPEYAALITGPVGTIVTGSHITTS
jgi:hypothetical protein